MLHFTSALKLDNKKEYSFKRVEWIVLHVVCVKYETFYIQHINAKFRMKCQLLQMSYNYKVQVSF